MQIFIKFQPKYEADILKWHSEVDHFMKLHLKKMVMIL